MKKLYNRIDGILHYHEAWEADGEIVEHWGRAGERGEQRSHEIRVGQSEADAIEAVLEKPRATGFEEIDQDDHSILLIIYPIAGMGTRQDIEKRHALQDRMDDTLGWTGLGHCDGGSTGSGTMEVCCYVVDFEIAKRTIADDLKGTPFADYAEITEE
jgi:hypothetical protein